MRKREKHRIGVIEVGSHWEIETDLWVEAEENAERAWQGIGGVLHMFVRHIRN